MEPNKARSIVKQFREQNKPPERRTHEMKTLHVLAIVVLAALLLTACGSIGNPKPAAQAPKDTSHEVDMEVLTARRYRDVQLAQLAKDYSHEVDMEVLTARRYRDLQLTKAYDQEVDMEVLTARHYRAIQLLQAAEALADAGQEVDMEVLTARRYQVQQTAEAVRIAQASKP
jgi:hypothetical protein